MSKKKLSCMKLVAIMVPITANSGFLGQVAAIRCALLQLRWERWTWQLHICIGGYFDAIFLDMWRQQLPEVSITLASAARFGRDGDWAQSDDQLRCAPRDADVVMAMDADVLPVAGFEDILDRVEQTGCVAGVMAHYRFPGWEGQTPCQDWQTIAAKVLSRPLDFANTYSLVASDAPEEQLKAPFYINFGAVFFAASAFHQLLPTYLRIRHQIERLLPTPDFSAQVALTLALTEEAIPTLALPMRYNFPNDETAALRYPEELEHVAFWHYLRTNKYNRQMIFASPAQYRHFVSLALKGPHLKFQQTVVRLLGNSWPFPYPLEPDVE